jgi:hypothetical protein
MGVIRLTTGVVDVEVVLAPTEVDVGVVTGVSEVTFGVSVVVGAELE